MKAFSLDRLGSKKEKILKPEVADLELLYHGEVYRWQSVKQDEQRNNIKECVVIIQNDYQNNLYESTVALLCTTNKEECASIDFSFNFDYEIMPDYNIQRIRDYTNCTFYISRLKEINRREMGDYLGTFDGKFMDTLQSVVDYFLGFNRAKSISKIQIMILSNADIDELLDIADSCSRTDKKIERCLECFGFDMSVNGMEYLRDAIWLATGLNECKLDVLAKFVAEKDGANASEVLRLIVARIKENFGFKNANSMEFIRLMVSLLKKA